MNFYPCSTRSGCLPGSGRPMLHWTVLHDEGSEFMGHRPPPEQVPHDPFPAHRVCSGRMASLCACLPRGCPYETWPKAMLPPSRPCGIRLVLAGGSLLQRTPNLYPSWGFWLHGERETQTSEVGGEDIFCPTFNLPLHIGSQCLCQSGETWFPAQALRNVGSPGSPANHAWTDTEILGKRITGWCASTAVLQRFMNKRVDRL